MSEVDGVLSLDPIDMAEKIAGKHWSKFTEDEQLTALQFAFATNKLKQDALDAHNDTSFRTSWPEFKKILTDNGFKPALEYEFLYEGIHKEEAIIYYRPDGLLLWAESYFDKTVVNGGTVYGECTYDPNDMDSLWKAMERCSNGSIDRGGKPVRHFSYDVREGLINALSKFGGSVKLNPVWENKDTFLWFVDYVETKSSNYNYQTITKKKIGMMCPEARAILANRVI